MFPASFSRSPNVLVLLHRSEPARSQRENLKNTNMFISELRLLTDTIKQKTKIQRIWSSV